MKNKIFMVCLLSLVPCCFAMKHSKARYTDTQKTKLTELSQTAGFDEIKPLIGQLSSSVKNEESFLTLLENATARSEALKTFADEREVDAVTEEHINETLYKQALSYLASFISVCDSLQTKIKRISTDSSVEHNRTRATDIIRRINVLRGI